MAEEQNINRNESLDYQFSFFVLFVRNHFCKMANSRVGKKRGRTINNNVELSAHEKRAKKVKSKF